MNFKKAAQSFLRTIFSEMKDLNLVLAPHWDIDHLCYRVESQIQYLKMREVFSEYSDLLIESEVNGRLISTFELHEPIRFDEYQINLIELPAPKPGKITKEGFEHFEIVCDEPFANIIQKNPRLKFDVSGLAKLFNQELEVQLNSGVVKFHHLSLSSVIALEKNKKAWSALYESKVLSLLKDLTPLVAGTFPLGIETSSSDLDILVYSKNIHDLKSKIEFHYGSYEKLQTEITTIDGLPTLLAKFICAGIPFEIFAQDRPSVQQKAYQHFLAEEKILKFGGGPVLSAIKALRNQGMKTEPAFARVLGHDGDPFQVILDLQVNSLAELKKKVQKFLSTVS